MMLNDGGAAGMSARLSAEVIADVRARLLVSDWAGAAALCRKSLVAFPSNAFLLSSAHKAAVQLGELVAAREFIERALEAAPEVAAYHSLSGRLYQKLADHDAALCAFQRAAALTPEVAAHQAAIGAVLYAQNRYREAIASYHAALQLDGSQVAWWNRLARSATLAGELSLAVEAYSRSLALKEDFAVLAALMEVQRQHAAGRAEAGEAAASYYDAIFRGSSKYAQHGSVSEYVGVWREITDSLIAAGTRKVLDLGCGPGQFAEYLRECPATIGYTGIDFSEVAIQQARVRCPDYRFEVVSLPNASAVQRFDFDAVICTEVLEHIDQDLSLIESIPAGVEVLATVPNFDSFGHLRYFRSAAQVVERYGHLIGNLQVTPIALSPTSTIWLLRGQKRSPDMRGAAETSGVGGFVGPADGTHVGVPPRVTESLALSHVHEAVLWTDRTRYVEDLLAAFGLPFCSLLDSLSVTTPHVALRHDVDWSIENALAMATLESQLGVRSTYFLLHPDGQYSPANYFGHVSEGQLHIDPRVFSYAKQLLDLGHEVALHNDLITLGLNTLRQPGEFLEQILESVQTHGIPIRGTVAHGSRRGRIDGYLNYQIFRELRGKLFEEYANSPDHERFFASQVKAGAHAVEKFTIAMADYGLAYEGNFVPHGLYVADSSARWFFLQDGQTRYLDRFAESTEMLAVLRTHLLSRDVASNIQCLVHACHWSPLSNYSPVALAAIKARRNGAHHAKLLDAKALHLQRRQNVLQARASPRFDLYDKKYGSNAQLYSIAPSVASFVGQYVSENAASIDSVLELGCGQGDFLEFVRTLLVRQRPEAVSPFCIGVDGSVEGIQVCAARYPACWWVADSIEAFMAWRESRAASDSRAAAPFDLVLDKTGTVFIENYHAARATLRAIHEALAPGGVYCYVASKHYYQSDLMLRVYREWDQDWLSLAADEFGTPEIFDDIGDDSKGYFKRVFVKCAEGV